MKTFLDLAKERYSVRNYLDRPIVCPHWATRARNPTTATIIWSGRGWGRWYIGGSFK